MECTTDEIKEHFGNTEASLDVTASLRYLRDLHSRLSRQTSRKHFSLASRSVYYYAVKKIAY